MEASEAYVKVNYGLNTTEQYKTETKYLDSNGNQVPQNKATKKIVEFFDVDHHVTVVSLFIRFSTESPW